MRPASRPFAVPSSQRAAFGFAGFAEDDERAAVLKVPALPARDAMSVVACDGDLAQSRNVRGMYVGFSLAALLEPCPRLPVRQRVALAIVRFPLLGLRGSAWAATSVEPLRAKPLRGFGGVARGATLERVCHGAGRGGSLRPKAGTIPRGTKSIDDGPTAPLLATMIAGIIVDAFPAATAIKTAAGFLRPYL